MVFLPAWKKENQFHDIHMPKPEIHKKVAFDQEFENQAMKSWR